MAENDFKGMFNRARDSHTYHVEAAVLEFTEELVERMEQKGISRSELARRIDSSPAYITKILRGNSNFTLDSMVKIARALDCTYRSHLEPAGCESKWFDVMRHWEPMKERPKLSTQVWNHRGNFVPTPSSFSHHDQESPDDPVAAIA